MHCPVRTRKIISQPNKLRRRRDAEHPLPIEFRRLHQAGLHVHRAFRASRRSGRIQPEAGVVGPRRICFATRRTPMPSSARVRDICRRFARDDDVACPAADLRGFQHRRQPLFGDDDCLGATVAQHVGVIRGRPHCVDGNRNDAGLDRAQEACGKIDAVVQAKQDTLFRLNAKLAKRVSAAVDALRQFGVACASRSRR